MVSSYLSCPSIARCVRSSFAGCPAPAAAEVLRLAQSFPGLGVVSVRPSGRSFSGWVAVCSFRDRAVASSFSRAAAAQLLGDGCFCVVRSTGRRFRVSVPCLSPRLFASRARSGARLDGRFVRVRVPLRSVPAVVPGGGGPDFVPALRSLFAGVRSVGFSGSRSPSAGAELALAVALALVPASGRRVSVGCARGIDELVRGRFAGSRSLLVFEASAPRFAAAGPVGALALRSAACVRSVARGSRGLLVVFPSGKCPVGVRPGRSFRGCGSGSWGSAALAAGLGRRVLVWLEKAEFVPLVWSGFSWLALGSGWFLLCPAPAAVQLSLL